QVKVGGELHFACSVLRGLIDVRDNLIRAVARIRGEVHLAQKLFVGARLAEGFAGENIDARLDLNPDDLSLKSCGKCREYKAGTQRRTDHGDSSNLRTWGNAKLGMELCQAVV